MRTTLVLNDELLKEAQKLTKIKEKTALVNLGLKSLIEQAARKRLIALGGSDKNAKAPKRRRVD
jgi:Arc/MetJ family transcription regulator